MDDLPALLGGTPIRPEGPPDWPFPDHEVVAALTAALADGSWGKYSGGRVAELEAALAEYHAVPHALTCASGTLASEIALRALHVGPGAEVIMAAYDYEPNFLSIHVVGAQPVLVDVEPRNWNFDPAQLHAAISPATKAIIVSHLHGGIVDMKAVMRFAAAQRLFVIEDAAQAPGALVHGRKAGTWGDVGVLSFGGSKLLTAGRGGALLTSQSDVAQRLRLELRRGVQSWAAMSELQATVLLPQLAQLDARNQQRLLAVERLRGLLVDVDGLRLCENAVPADPAYYKVGFQFDESAFGLTRARLVAALRAEGMAFDAGFRSLAAGRSPLRYRAASALPQAEQAHRGAVLLHHPVLLKDAEALEQVARALRKVYSNAQRLSALNWPNEPSRERTMS